MIVRYNTRKNCNWQPTTRAMFNNECLLDTYCREKTNDCQQIMLDDLLSFFLMILGS